MVVLIKSISKREIKNSEGNSFFKGLNDCENLKRRRNYVVIRFEIVDPNLKRNVGICIGMARVEYGASKAEHETLSKIIK